MRWSEAPAGWPNSWDRKERGFAAEGEGTASLAHFTRGSFSARPGTAEQGQNSRPDKKDRDCCRWPFHCPPEGREARPLTTRADLASRLSAPWARDPPKHSLLKTEETKET